MIIDRKNVINMIKAGSPWISLFIIFIWIDFSRIVFFYFFIVSNIEKRIHFYFFYMCHRFINACAERSKIAAIRLLYDKVDSTIL